MKKTIILILLLVFMRANTYCHNSVQYDGLHCVSYTESGSVPAARDDNLTTDLLLIMPSNVSALPQNAMEYSHNMENRDDAVLYAQEKQREVIQKAEIRNASPEYGNCLMEIVSDDGGKTGYMILTFVENAKFNGYIDNGNGERKKVPMIKTTFHSVEVDTLKTINRHPNPYNLDYSYPTRYVVGKTTIVNIVQRNDGSNITERYSSEDYPNEKYEITKEFYNDLKNFLGDLVPYSTEDEF